MREASLQTRLFALGAKSLSKFLTLQDRNPHSPTYGCFDRNFWHLRITDFPSGMAQEFVLPLAIAYAHDFAGNSFYRKPAIREWVRAGICYASTSAHPDGSCDDYYPFEKAAGAAAFSLYAILEAASLTNLDPEPFLPFLKRRATWLGHHRESGRISNHEALIANVLFRYAALSGEARFVEIGTERVKRLLNWQSLEGWFYEYQGCDPGYMTLTLANLAELHEVAPELELSAPIEQAVDFLHALQPPDGWLGGEWTSRNTNNFFPHGLELIGAWYPPALDINTRAVASLDPAPEYDDDHIIGHHCWSYLKAALNWREERPEIAYKAGDRIFLEAGLSLISRGEMTLLTAEKKGGCFRLYRGSKLIFSDTGVSVLRRERWKTRNYVCHLWSEHHEVLRHENGVEIVGQMGRAKASGMTPIKNIVLRGLMLTFGRLNPDLIRRLLQRMLITGAPKSPLKFRRYLEVHDDALVVSDTIEGKGEIVSCGIGAAQTSIYTVMSRVYHWPQLQEWTDLTGMLTQHGTVRLKHGRKIGDKS